MISKSFIFLVLLAAVCSAGQMISHTLGIETAATDLGSRFLPPSPQHFLGTDELGRDTFLRLLEGGRVSLGVGITAALLSGLIGTFVGIIAGYTGGKTDAMLMRFTDFLIALPLLPLLMILSAIDLGKIGIHNADLSGSTSLYKIILLISLFGWVTVARLARARALILREMPFVMAARGLGVTDTAIIRRHILPNLAGTVIVAASLSAGNFILMESVLSFLGLGIQPPMASWGNMLSNAEDNIWEHAELAVYPGIMIFVTVLCFNFLGDALQKALDPRQSRRMS